MALETITCSSPPFVQSGQLPELKFQRLRQFEALVSERVEKVLTEKHGISLNEYSALASLYASSKDGMLRQQVLADAIPVRLSSATRLVARLEKQEYSQRYLCQDDRRGVYTQITETGIDTLTRARVDVAQVLQDIRSELADHEEYGELVSLI